jgi:hypothetical protein
MRRGRSPVKVSFSCGTLARARVRPSQRQGDSRTLDCKRDRFADVGLGLPDRMVDERFAGRRDREAS